MPRHSVSFELPKRDIGNADAKFFIQKDGSVLGKIEISQGGLDYYPSNRKKPIKISWGQFDKMVKEWNGEI